MDTDKKQFLSNLATREQIAELYFRNLGDKKMRENHVFSTSTTGTKTTTPPSREMIATDVRAWYAGFLSLALNIDPNALEILPQVHSIEDYVTKVFADKARGIAA